MDKTTWRDQLRSNSGSFLPGSFADKIALACLLTLALVLRLWGFPSIPFSHDEISALVRVDYSTIGDAIAKGVVGVDTHPPGTHAFLWCWTQLFGFGDGVVKAPFMLMSVLALFLLYRVMYAWTGGAVALIGTALMATMQYTVMYGQIARPYAMGFFTTALLADQLTRYIGNEQRRHLIVLCFAAVLSAYTHHFSLMLATFMCITALFLVSAEQRRAYLIASAIMVLCYVPNIPLFFAQLGMKGLDEWLTAPSPEWILDYAWWIAHCSALFALVLVLLCGGSLFLRIKQKSTSAPVLIIALVWGLLPLVIGYAYSVWRSPVLQYSVVLFSFPYLLMGILAGLRHLAPMHGIVVAGVCATISTFTLATERRHFELVRTSKYEDIVRGTIEAEKNGTLAIVDLPEEVVVFYRKLWCLAPSQAPYINLRTKPLGILDSLLVATEASSCFYGQTTHAQPENVAKVQARFPFLVRRLDRSDGQTFLFRSSPSRDRIDDTDLKGLRTPQAIGGEDWVIDSSIKLVSDTTHAPFLALERWDFTWHEYGAVFEKPLSELAKTDNDVIEVRADVERSEPLCDLRLVAELKSGDSTVFYRASELRELPRTKDRSLLITAVKLADLPSHGKGLRLKAYLYNPGLKRASISSLSVRVRQGNPVLYGYFQPIRSEWRYR